MRSAFVLLLVFANSAFAGPNDPLNLAEYSSPVRVACIGDSITEGVGTKGGWAWPMQLERMLGDPWDVRNFGKSYSTAWKQARRPYWGWPDFKLSTVFCPDIVIIALGTNDAAEWNNGAKKEFARDYRALVLEYQKLPSKPRIVCCLPLWTTNKERVAAMPEVIQTITAIAKEQQCGVLDLQTASQGKKDLFPDGLHPNKEGAALVAVAIYQTLVGKTWSGTIPPPAFPGKEHPPILYKEHPGELSFDRACALILSECNLTTEQRRQIAAKYRANAGPLERKIAQLQSDMARAEKMRMLYKYSDPDLYGKFKSLGNSISATITKVQREAIEELTSLIPDSEKTFWGAARLRHYLIDRLRPVADTLSSAQLKQVDAICQQRALEFGRIDNTPERSLAEAEAFGVVHREALSQDQKKRVPLK